MVEIPGTQKTKICGSRTIDPDENYLPLTLKLTLTLTQTLNLTGGKLSLGEIVGSETIVKTFVNIIFSKFLEERFITQKTNRINKTLLNCFNQQFFRFTWGEDIFK